MQLRDKVQIVMIEPPLRTTSLAYVEGGKQPYDRMVGWIRLYAKREGIAFWETTGVLSFPESGWRTLTI